MNSTVWVVGLALVSSKTDTAPGTLNSTTWVPIEPMARWIRWVTSSWNIGTDWSPIADCSDSSDCPTICPYCECCWCIGQALHISSQLSYHNLTTRANANNNETCMTTWLWPGEKMPSAISAQVVAMGISSKLIHFLIRYIWRCGQPVTSIANTSFHKYTVHIPRYSLNCNVQ